MEYVYLDKEVILKNIRNLSQVTFEVTDTCNLQCKYCGYGELYDGYDVRKNKMLTLEQVYPLLEYLYANWQQSDSYHKKTYISFLRWRAFAQYGFYSWGYRLDHETPITTMRFYFHNDNHWNVIGSIYRLFDGI